jgi:hypothetical protein
MKDSRLTTEDVRAAAEVHRELGPDYGDAVVESFLAKIDKQIEARVDERLAGLTGQVRPARRRRPADPVRLGKLRIALAGLVAGSMVAGIPLTIMFVRGDGTPSPDSGATVLFLWAILVVIYGLAAIRLRRR